MEFTKEWFATARWGFIVTSSVFFVTWLYYYFKVLDGSGEDHKSLAYIDYLKLRESLEFGGTFNLRYVAWLSWTLNKVDVFFGDAPGNDQSSLARRVGLQTAGPTWTAPSYDKSLLLALLYPVATMLAIWIAFGHVGVAERALGLREAGPDVTGFRRAMVGVAAVGATIAVRQYLRAKGTRANIFWLVACVVAVSGAVAVSVSGSGAVAATSAVARVVAGDVALAVIVLSEYSKDRDRFGLFLDLFSILMLLACFAAAWFLSPLAGWRAAGPLLAIFGLLTLVNAPFDWAAIGLTRFLLRKSLAWGGPWPYALAILDAVAAAISVALLAFVAVLAVQTFDDIALLRGGDAGRVLPLGPLFDKLLTNPADSENWWIWLMLFSTAIPSVVNLAIASFAFLRGVPFVTKWMLSRMPENAAMRPRDQMRVAAALAGQVAIGLLLTASLLYLLFDDVVPLALPWLGAIIRGFSEQIAAYNAPAHVMKWLAGYGW